MLGLRAHVLVTGAPPDSLIAARFARYLRGGRTESARQLASKAVVAVDPPELRGVTVWPL